MEESRVSRVQCRLQEYRERILEQIPCTKIGDKKPTSIIYEDTAINQIDISSMIFCDDMMVEGCLRALCSMMDRANKYIQTATEKYFPQLLLFSQAACGLGDEESILRMAVSSTNLFTELCEFQQEIFQLFRNMIHQMHAFRKQDPSVFAISKNVEFPRAWRCLGDLLAITIQIDEIILSRPNIRCVYLAMNEDLETRISEAGARMKSDPKLAEKLGKVYLTFRMCEKYYLSGNAFRYVYEDTIGDLDTSEEFSEHMFKAVTDMYAKWEKSADEDQPDKRQLLAICGLAVYYHLHFSNFSHKSLIKKVLSSHKKIGAFSLLGDIRFFPGDFILREIGDHSVFTRKEIDNVLKSREDSRMIPQVFEAVIDEAFGLAKETDGWMNDIRRRIKDGDTPGENLARVCIDVSELFLKGVRYADTLSRQVQVLLLKYKINHDVRTLMVKKNDANKILTIIGAIKTIGFTFEANWRTFEQTTTLASQQRRCHVVLLVEKARKVLKASNVPENEKKCRNGALTIAADNLLRTMNISRVGCICLALEIAGINKLLKADDQRQLLDLMNRVEHFANLRNLASRTTNCSFLAHYSTIICVFWGSVIERKPDFLEIKKWLDISSDCTEYWKKSQDPSDELKPNFYELIREAFLSKLCHMIENDLRISTHQHLAVDKEDCLSEEDSAYIKILLKNGVLRMYDEIIDIREFVTRYLEKTFYNLTIIAPHDAQTYAKMANFAKIKFGLEVINGDLPQDGIDESCDMVDLVKNLSNVVVTYNYSMTRELFVQKQSPNRKLHIFTQSDLIKALHKFGNGLVPTATNIAYQILRKKLNVFYQFLSDDHIRAQIDHDIRLLKSQKESDNKICYNMEMADNFTKKIAMIGGKISSGTARNSAESTKGSIISGQTADDDDEKPVTYIDRFRILITQIGNTLGFVRSIGLASKNVESEMGDFVSTEITRLLDEISIEEKKHEALDRLKTIYKPRQTRENSDFNHLLVNVFKDALSKDLTDLTNFYIIIPAISKSYVEYMLTCRNRSKQCGIMNHNDYTIVNDGFPVGVAYLLTVLGIWSKFEEIDWFNTTDSFLESEMNEVSRTLTPGNVLKKERLRNLHDEYEELQQSLYTARIFFEFEDVVKHNNNDIDENWF